MRRKIWEKNAILKTRLKVYTANWIIYCTLMAELVSFTLYWSGSSGKQIILVWISNKTANKRGSQMTLANLSLATHMTWKLSLGHSSWCETRAFTDTLKREKWLVSWSPTCMSPFLGVTSYKNSWQRMFSWGNSFL